MIQDGFFSYEVQDDAGKVIVPEMTHKFETKMTKEELFEFFESLKRQIAIDNFSITPGTEILI